MAGQFEELARGVAGLRDVPSHVSICLHTAMQEVAAPASCHPALPLVRSAHQQSPAVHSCAPLAHSPHTAHPHACHRLLCIHERKT